jgi:hypothetical protein
LIIILYFRLLGYIFLNLLTLANRLIKTETPPSLDAALEAAAKLTAGNPSPEEESEAYLEADDDTPRPTAVRLNRQEYEYLKNVFATRGHGLKVSTGMKMAALYIAERVEDGKLSISKAGISDRRG